MEGKPPTVRRGAAFSIGTPPQNLAFIPNFNANNTQLYDVKNNQCDAGKGSIPAQCPPFGGGVFDETKSSTWTGSDNPRAIGIMNDLPESENCSWGVDKFEPGANFSSLAEYPFSVIHSQVNNPGLMMNSLGLGRNSTLLNSLVSSGAIASRIWSMYDGWTGSQSKNQRDGSLVFGGYDAAKTVGDNITIGFSTDPTDLYERRCEHVVAITDMQLQLINGSLTSLLPPTNSRSLRYCIMPDYPWISVNTDIWKNMLSLTGSTDVGRSTSPLTWSQELLSTDTAFDGNLVITMFNELRITIPNHELVKPLVDINSEGKESIMNSSSVRATAFYKPKIDYDYGVLGRAFLSSAYMMVDNEQKQFTLWQGKPSDEENLVSVTSAACLSSPPPPPRLSATSPSETSTTPIIQDPGVSKSAMGGVAVLIIFIFASFFGIWYYLTRRRRGQAETLDPINKQSIFALERPYDGSTPNVPSNPQRLPQDLPSSQTINETAAAPPYELTAVKTFPVEAPENHPSHPAVFAELDGSPGSRMSLRNGSRKGSRKLEKKRAPAAERPSGGSGRNLSVRRSRSRLPARGELPASLQVGVPPPVCGKPMSRGGGNNDGGGRSEVGEWISLRDREVTRAVVRNL